MVVAASLGLAAFISAFHLTSTLARLTQHAEARRDRTQEAAALRHLPLRGGGAAGIHLPDPHLRIIMVYGQWLWRRCNTVLRKAGR